MHSSRSILSSLAIAVAIVFATASTAVAAGDITSVSFRDANNGYMVGGYFPDSMSRTGFASVTRDGGKTWTAQALPGTRPRGVAASPLGAFGVSEYFPWVLGYSDLGGVWGNSSVDPAVSDSDTLYDVATRSNNRVVAVGEREAYGKVGVIMASENGGATWTKAFEGPVYPPSGEDPAPSTYAAMSSVDISPADRTGWALGNEWVSSGTGSTGYLTYKRRIVFRSVESTSGWTQIAVPTASTQRALSAVAGISANEMWGFGSGGQYAKTTDGGATWVQGWLPAPVPAMEVVAADGDGTRIVIAGLYQSGIRTYQRKIAYTLNGGTTWTVYTPAGSLPLRDVQMLSQTEWVIVGDNETILRTTDSGATWTGQTASKAPVAKINAPTAGFGMSALPISIEGTSTDEGVGVVKVEYRIRRADAKTYDPVAGWTTADTWLTAGTTNGWRDWSASWTPDVETRALGSIVTISVRATDALGNVGTPVDVASGLPFTASVSVAGGAAYATASDVPVQVSASGASQMRWKIDSGAFSAPTAYSTSTTVTLGAVDGPKTVTFEFLSATGSLLGSASDAITLDRTAPAVSIGSPSDGYALSTSPVAISGEATDAVAGVAAVSVLVRRSDGRSWNGTAWVSGDAWLPASTTDGFRTWNVAWTPEAELVASGQIVTIQARATDAAGLVTTTAAIDAYTPFTASVSLNGGAAITNSINVTATVSVDMTGVAPQDVSMRWSTDGATFTPPRTFAPAVAVTLPAGADGTRRVDFEFSADGFSSVVATASDTIFLENPVAPPTVGITSPSAGFAPAAGITTVSGVAQASAPAAISAVELRIRRSDGLFWNGLAWVGSEIWLTVSGSTSWSYQWNSTLAAATEDGIVSLTARARDSRGQVTVSEPVASSAPLRASVSIASGAPYSRTATVAVDVASSGASHMRWRVGSGAFTSWQSYASTATVGLGSGDGTKTVTFEFSADGVREAASASDTIVLDATAPTVSFTSPALYFSRAVTSLRPAGRSTDALSGLTGTRLGITRGGLWWDHGTRAWVDDETWVPEAAIGTPAAWSYTWVLDAATKSGTTAATVIVESEDAAGNVRRVTSIARPKAKPYLTYPASTYRAVTGGSLRTGVPKYAVSGRYYYAVGYAKHSPAHAYGAKAGVLEAWRYERQRNGTYKWIRRKTWTAPAYNYGRYRVRIALTRGTWRLRLVHPEDAVALSGASAMRTIYVR